MAEPKSAGLWANSVSGGAGHYRCPKQRVIWTSSMTDPFSFGELLTLHTRTGWGSRVVSSWCFCTKLRFMNMPVALESRSADMPVEMDASEVREVSLTWMLRE